MPKSNLIILSALSAGLFLVTAGCAKPLSPQEMLQTEPIHVDVVAKKRLPYMSCVIGEMEKRRPDIGWIRRAQPKGNKPWQIYFGASSFVIVIVSLDDIDSQSTRTTVRGMATPREILPDAKWVIKSLDVCKQSVDVSSA